MSLPRSRPELPRLSYSWGSLRSPSGELVAVLAGAFPCPLENEPARKDLLGRVAAALRTIGGFYFSKYDAPLPDHPELFSARRVALEPLGEDRNVAPGSYLILGRAAAARWDRLRRNDLHGSEYPWGERLSAGGARFDTGAWLALPAAWEEVDFSWKTEAAGLAHPTFFQKAIWIAALASREAAPRLVAGLPYFAGRPPSPGWVNAFRTVWQAHTGLRTAILNDRPAEFLEGFPVWAYRVGVVEPRGAAAWRTVEVVPSRRQLAIWAGRDGDPWSLSEELRFWKPPQEGFWPSPDSAAPAVERLLAVWEALSPVDLRLIWENVVFPLVGVEAASFWIAEGKIPFAVRAVLKARVRGELDRALRRNSPTSNTAELATLAGGAVDRALEQKNLTWSQQALDIWTRFWREPAEASKSIEFTELSDPLVWSRFFSDDAFVIEETLRRLDPTDAALCLRSTSDTRWRRHVTARREAEIRREMEYCAAMESRSELSKERALDAWRCFHREWKLQTSRKEKSQREK